MKIGLLLPTILASQQYNSRIFAPKGLFIYLADGLVDRGHEVYVYTSADIKTKAKLIPGDKELETNHLYSIKDIWEQSHIRQLMSENKKANEYNLELLSRSFIHAQKNKLDIIHVYADFNSYYFSSFVKIPLVFTLHDPVFPKDTFEYWRLKHFSKHYHIALSHQQKNQYEKAISLKPVAVIYHGIDLKKFQFSVDCDNHMSMIGRFIPEKGFAEGIKLAIQLKTPLSIASSSNYEKTSYYVNEIKPYLSSPYISKLEFLGPDQRDYVLKKARVFLFPIQWEEPFGLTMIEAMANGTPVIAFARGSAPEIIKDGETGFLVNPSEEDIRGSWITKKSGFEGFKEAVKKIYALPDKKYKEMRYACRSHVEKNFTVERMIGDHEKTYSEIIEKSTKNIKD
jgi:glycosyltransferase involved in cell wall biosynthesis